MWCLPRIPDTAVVGRAWGGRKGERADGWTWDGRPGGFQKHGFVDLSGNLVPCENVLTVVT